jgi:hypothetical protein
VAQPPLGPAGRPAPAAAGHAAPRSAAANHVAESVNVKAPSGADAGAAMPSASRQPDAAADKPANAQDAVATATAVDSDLARKLADLSLSEAQVQAVLALSRDVVERVVWEVVPDLAEAIIREELKRLTQ